jgi:hypothetical protein
MKYEYMFLCLIVPGPDHPGPRINMMLKPLIDELKQLWEGVEAYDYDQKQKFCKIWSSSAFKLVSKKKRLNRGKDPAHRYDADGHVRKAKRMVRGHVLLSNLYVVM